MKMKKKSLTILITCLTAMALMTSSMAFGETLTTTLKTDKTTYLMDPYHWVYTATVDWPKRWGILWPAEGYPRTVTFTVKIYDENGDPASVADVSFEVYNAAVLLASGAVTETAELGTYEGSFELNEANLGAAAFSGHDPKELALEISTAAEGLIKEHPVSVGRWGCDRCHIGTGIYGSRAREIYPWSMPTGGMFGPHGWANVLGASHTPGGFNLDFLTDAEYTHTPTENLNIFPFHEKTIVKWGLVDDCTPCHQGSGKLRYPWWGDGESAPWKAQGRSEAVECTFCHGMEGGYVPADESWWVDNAGYISETHMHNTVPLLPETVRNPYLANQTCSNPGCHGHIDDDAEGEVLHNKPNCRDCHGVHNDDL
jgi:hypothetical protein